MASIAGSEGASGDGPHQGLSQRRRLKASPPACPVCLDLRPDLLQTYHQGPTLTTRCGSVFEQKSCRICRYITDAILQLSKPLVADHVDIIPSLHPIELEVVLHEGYNTEVKVSILGFDLSVEIFALTGFSSPVFAFEDAPDRPAVLDITTCTQFIKRYLDECEEDSHSCCESEVSEMPTRLLLIGSTGSPCLKLVEAPPTKQKYVALSHCWGDQSGILKTTKSTLEERLLDISWNSLSKTFQDSIQITRSLDIKFLWIDSLCIVQNNPSDWEKESVKMAQIYSQAYLTIAAASASSGSMGCLFSRFSPELGGKSISTVCLGHENDPCGHAIHARYTSQAHSSFGRGHGTVPLWSRAWAFQERYLSRRTIHFHAEEMIWDCRESRYCECGYYAWREDYGLDDLDHLVSHVWDTDRLRSSLSKVFRRQLTRKKAFITWLQAIEIFAEMDITYQLDKLPTLSGIASYLVPVMKSHCIAGIWEYKMATGLMWNNKKGCARGRRVENTATRYIPTWS